MMTMTSLPATHLFFHHKHEHLPKEIKLQLLQLLVALGCLRSQGIHKGLGNVEGHRPSLQGVSHRCGWPSLWQEHARQR